MLAQFFILIIGIGIGAFFSWYFTRLYYSRAKREANAKFKEIISCIRKKSIETVKEFVEDRIKADKIIKEIWQTLTKKHGKEFLKHRCPYCGSENIIFGSVSVYDGEVDIASCGECGEEIW